MVSCAFAYVIVTSLIPRPSTPQRAGEAVEELALAASSTHAILQNTLTKVALLAHTKFIESVRGATAARRRLC